MKSKYELEISSKTRFLNFFRKIFKIRPLENFLIKKTRATGDFWERLIPPNYLYAKNSRREVSRRGINYSLDISDYMEHSVYFGFCDDAQKELFRLAKNKKGIIDVGVNIGATLLNFAKICPVAQVIGFEPDAKNLLKAKRNLKLNDLGNVKIIPKGLGEEPAKVKLFKVNQANEGMNRILNDAEHIKDFDFEEIEIVRFDDFAKENSSIAIDLIKIDVEGYELKVLKGAEQSLRKYLPVLFIELDDENLKAQNDSAQSLILFLKEIGYKIYRAGTRQPVESGDDFSLCHFDIVCEKRSDA